MTSAPLAPNALGSDLQDLRSLLDEVNLLAVRLRQFQRPPDTLETIPAAGRSILKILDLAGPQTVPQMARTRSTTRQNIQVLVDRLESDGWVKLSPNPAHQRSQLVKLTARARDTIPKLQQDEEALLSRIIPSLSREGVQATREFLRLIEGALAQEDPTPEAPTAASTSAENSGAAPAEEPQAATVEKADEETVSPEPPYETPPENEELPVNLL
jgi:DNA-binding MarR family transcriptional regulator